MPSSSFGGGEVISAAGRGFDEGTREENEKNYKERYYFLPMRKGKEEVFNNLIYTSGRRRSRSPLLSSYGSWALRS